MAQHWLPPKAGRQAGYAHPQTHNPLRIQSARTTAAPRRQGGCCEPETGRGTSLRMCMGLGWSPAWPSGWRRAAGCPAAPRPPPALQGTLCCPRRAARRVRQQTPPARRSAASRQCGEASRRRSPPRVFEWESTRWRHAAQKPRRIALPLPLVGGATPREATPKTPRTPQPLATAEGGGAANTTAQSALPAANVASCVTRPSAPVKTPIEASCRSRESSRWNSGSRACVMSTLPLVGP